MWLLALVLAALAAPSFADPLRYQAGDLLFADQAPGPARLMRLSQGSPEPVLATDLEDEPRGLALSPHGDLLLAAGDRVLRIRRDTGAAHVLATGLVDAGGIAVTPEGAVLVATAEGVLRLHPLRGLERIYPGPAIDVAGAPGGIVYATVALEAPQAAFDLVRISEDAADLLAASLDADTGFPAFGSTGSVAVEADGHVLVGTAQGLMRFASEGGEPELLFPAAPDFGRGGSWIGDIAATGSGHVFVLGEDHVCLRGCLGLGGISGMVMTDEHEALIRTWPIAALAFVGPFTPLPETTDPPRRPTCSATSACTMSRKGRLVAREHAHGAKLRLHLGDAPAGALGDVGDPASPLEVCIRNETGAPVASLRIPDDATCVEGPCWRTGGGSRLRYRDRFGWAHGVRKIDVRRGRHVAFRLKAREASIDGFPVGLAAALAGSTSATVQIVAGGRACLEVALDEVERADGSRFRARGRN